MNEDSKIVDNVDTMLAREAEIKREKIRSRERMLMAFGGWAKSAIVVLGIVGGVIFAGNYIVVACSTSPEEKAEELQEELQKEKLKEETKKEVAEWNKSLDICTKKAGLKVCSDVMNLGSLSFCRRQKNYVCRSEYVRILEANY